jgi:ATP-dependent Clp protease, protease subunit
LVIAFANIRVYFYRIFIHMEGIIFIKGEIGVEKDAKGNAGYTFSNALIDLEKNKLSDVLHIYIDSPGGDYNDGTKIYNAFDKSGKIIITENSGMVASMAVNLFLLGSQRYYDPSKGSFIIHNPWGQVEGDADYVAEYSKNLKKAEKELASLYVRKTGALPDVITGLMQVDQPLTPEQVKTLGFAEIINNEFKAVAKINLIEMTEKEINDKIEAGTTSILDKIKAFAKKHGLIKSLVLKTADNKDLDFGDALQEASQIAVGSEAKVDGAPAEGDFLMPDGMTLVFKAGKVTEIKPKAEVNQELEALKTENAALKTQIEESKRALTEAQALVKDVQKDLIAFKAQVTSDIKGFKPEKPGEHTPGESRKPFKS